MSIAVPFGKISKLNKLFKPKSSYAFRLDFSGASI
jgi:hypothetical protein